MLERLVGPGTDVDRATNAIVDIQQCPVGAEARIRAIQFDHQRFAVGAEQMQATEGVMVQTVISLRKMCAILVSSHAVSVVSTPPRTSIALSSLFCNRFRRTNGP